MPNRTIRRAGLRIAPLFAALVFLLPLGTELSAQGVSAAAAGTTPFQSAQAAGNRLPSPILTAIQAALDGSLAREAGESVRPAPPNGGDVATPVPTTVAAPAAGATPTPAGLESSQANVERIRQATSEVRQLPFLRQVPVVVISRDQLARRLRQQSGNTNPQAQRQAANDYKALVAFGFIPSGFDLPGVERALNNAGIAGFYDYRGDKRMYLVADDPNAQLDMYALFTLEHELTHALQDQHFSLIGVELEAALGPGDRQLALTSLVEGDAVFSQALFVAQNRLSPEEMQQLQDETKQLSSDPALVAAYRAAPPILRDSIYFPYQVGPTFIAGLYRNGGWEAVNQAWRDYRPVSTSQILHPERFVDRIEPVKVDVGDLTPALGPGWRPISDDSMGEFETSVWLKGQHEEIDARQAAQVASAWAGDRYQVFEVNGTLGLAWHIVLANEDGAGQFTQLAAQTVAANYGVQGSGGAGPRRAWNTSGRTIRLVQRGRDVLLVVAPPGIPADAMVQQLGF